MLKIMEAEISNILDRYSKIKTTENCKYFKQLILDISKISTRFVFNIFENDSKYYILFGDHSNDLYNYNNMIYDNHIPIISNFVHELSTYINTHPININGILGNVDYMLNNHIDQLLADIKAKYNIELTYRQDEQVVSLEFSDIKNGFVKISIDQLEPLKYQFQESNGCQPPNSEELGLRC